MKLTAIDLDYSLLMSDVVSLSGLTQTRTTSFLQQVIIIPRVKLDLSQLLLALLNFSLLEQVGHRFTAKSCFFFGV